MSLQVWMPLNGNLNNQGLSEMSVTNTGAIVNAYGKIGSCYYFDGSSYITSSDTIIPDGTEFSIACWIKDEFTNENWHRIGGVNDHTYFHLDVDKYGRPRLFVSLDGTEDNYNAVYGTNNIIDGCWHHICGTANANTISIYVDGMLNKSVTRTSVYSENGMLRIGTINNGRNFVGYINDFRVYNHCLSPKEVKEIAKGLILHYKLDHKGTGGANFVDNSGPVVNTPWRVWSLSNDWTSSIVECSTAPLGVCARATAAEDSTTRGGLFINPWDRTNFVDGEVYTISAYIRSSVDGLVVNFRNDMMPNNLITISTEWKYYTYTAKININAAYYANTFYAYHDSQVIGGMYIEAHSLKMEKGSRATPWVPSINDSIYSELGFGTTDEPDCSGFGNNGIMSGSFEYDTDTPRYYASTVFNGTDTYIAAGTVAKIKDEITVALWAYMDDWTQFVDNGNRRFISCTETGGWNFQPTSNTNWLQFFIGTGTDSNTYAAAGINGVKIPQANMPSGWHHFVGSFNGLTVKFYLDGVLQETNNIFTTKIPIFYNANNGIFIGAEAGSSATNPINHTEDSFNGRLSDIRIYATALTDSQVKELYNTSGSVDNNGNLFCYQIEER